MIKWLLPLLCLLGVTPFTPFLDLYVSDLFFQKGEFSSHPYFFFFFHYGEIFGFFTGALALLTILLSFLLSRWKKWRRGALALVLTLTIGAGLITNVMFKGYWGRPRPKQVVEFGGHHPYRPFWHPDFHSALDPQKSFPSGHVAMGFYFLSLYLVGRRYQKQLITYAGLFLTLFLGGNLMISRMAQGAHFLSDVLVSPVLMWYVALAIDKFTWGEWEVPLPFLRRRGISLRLDEPSEVSE